MTTDQLNAYQQAETFLYGALASFLPPNNQDHHEEKRILQLALHKLHSHGLKDVALFTITMVPRNEREESAQRQIIAILTTVCPDWESRLDRDLADGW